MNRFKLLVAAALLGLPLAACEEGTAPPPVGQIDGQVVIEGEGIDGVSVTLSSGAATTTSGGGHFSFMDVEGGTYTITISGFPADASFNATTAEVTIATSGQTAAANFSGAWIRTASLMGMVTVEGTGLPGITVSISGRQDAQMLTDDNGQYTFTGLRAGNYTVEITGYDATGVAFSSTSSAVTVSAGESKVWSFEGTYVRESAISGQVSVEGNGLSDVTVSLQGMGADESEMTDMGGQFTFSNLRAGEYQLAISGYDTDEYGFTGEHGSSTTSATIRVEHGRMANVPFEGILLRTATVMGQVSVEGEGLANVTVSLSGEGVSRTRMTDMSGQYAFGDLPAGNFQVGISGYDTSDYSFEGTTSKNVAVPLGGTATVPFEGILLRTSGIAGRVSVDGMGLDGVTVTLTGDDLDEAVMETTANGGQYAIAGLAEGDYTVAISDYDAVEYAFEDSQDVTLAKDDIEIVNFTGKKLRTAAVMVTVTADGTGEAGVRADLIHVTNLATMSGSVIAVAATGTDGSYTFGNLLAGAYAVQISGTDEEIDFEDTLLPTQVATDQTAEITFAGTIIRTASIGGMVTVDDAGKPGVMVALSGGDDDVSDSRETDTDGAYTFPGLRRGQYTVSITNPDEAMYTFRPTSRDVSVGVGQPQTDISFAGSQVLMSSIRGTVTVEGEALPGVTVTLGGDGDQTRTTGPNGLYAFLNLGSGKYTVSIANPDDAAYIFDPDSISMDFDLGNSDEQSHNFDVDHTRDASITGMLFVDEGTKNNLHDEGEHALAAEGVKVTLVGPTLLMKDEKETNADGTFTFPELRQGDYRLELSAPGDAVMDDFKYGGDASYDIEVGVGADGGGTQNLPYDITHQTVNFTVNLKRGDEPLGPALPGATVSFFSDMAGEQKIGDDQAEADGMASLRFARSMATNHTVYASVAAPEGTYHTSGAMQAVTWDAKYPMHAASNDEDIVNTMADFSFSGATIMTDMGGGNALGGWEVSVTSGDEAVDGAPDELEDDGSVSFSEPVAAGDLPKSYKIEVVGWDDQSDDTISGDGGERFTSTTLTHTHDGLSLAGTSTDAGTLEVTYTTQRIRVYVHQENDQVMGYTGNVLGGDVRMGGIIDVDIEHIGTNGRSSSFEATDSVKSSAGGGVYQFWQVPADAKVIISADEFATLGTDADGDPIANTAHLLDKNGHSDELAAYTGVDANGIRSGLFGANGGFHHTVDLCPLMSDEGNQRHGECGTFAFVNTYHVFGQVWEWGHAKSGSGFASNRSKMGVPETTLGMDPVDGENLAGVDASFTEEGNAKVFDFKRMPAGVYELKVPDGWRARVGAPEEASGSAADSVSPLQGDLHIDLTPTTGYVYGVVTDAGTGQPVADARVTVNGVPAMTDAHGRYVARGFASTSYLPPGRTSSLSRQTVVRTSEDGATPTTHYFGFSANSPRRQDIAISMERITRISGSVTKSGTGVGIPNVRIWIDDAPPLNAREYSNPASRSTTIRELRTESDGSYEAHVAATGGTVAVTVSQDGKFFSPANHTVTAAENASISGINFTGFDNVSISGRVVDVDANGDSTAVNGVKVKATPTSGASARADSAYTSATGYYTLSLPYGQYSVVATRGGYTFESAGTQSINVPGTAGIAAFVVESVDETNATLSKLSLSGVTLCRTTTGSCTRATSGFRSATTIYSATVSNSVTMTTVSATATVDGADVEIYPEDADAFEPGHQIPLEVGDNSIEVTVTALDETSEEMYTVVVDRRDPSTTITGTVTDAVTGNGVGGVWLRVSGTTLLNGFTSSNVRYVSTGGDGGYEAIVESTGGEVIVIPVSNSRSFTPPSRIVRATAGSTISAIDFTAAEHGTIMGTVTDGTNPLEDVTVTATNGSSVRRATTSRRGSFTITRVPTGRVTITAEKDGYDFQPVDVFLGAGETRSLNISVGNTIQPTNVEGERDTDAANGAYDGMVTVTWMPGGAGSTDVTYTAQWCIVGDLEADPTENCAADDTRWGAFGTWNTADGLTVTADAPSDSDNGFMVRVMATHDGPDGIAGNDDDISVTSAPASVGAINVAPRNAAATRDIGLGRFGLTVEWNGARSAPSTGESSQGRIIASFDDGDTWVVLGAETIDFSDAGYTASVADDEPDHKWLFQLAANATANVVDGDDGTEVEDDGDTNDVNESQLDVTNAMLEGAFMIRVQMRHDGVDESDDDPPVDIWQRSKNADVGAS